ncbi:hypothetical protein LEP1GSC008_0682 [Leptospira kirschneri serovar Bulgarica str. Nikolaevo]|uniref:Uncharacterized protein n=1 Tax=Leptospira kirschneri serovar Bulgarica str. Nikolaevo TaxID=1240687 RepID=M6FJE0_9LEPT|nr:hypothetical protein LEP1GSC008_0682 [Leptospira kirschneri serovar Bulgarica str. Nikolaevo]
MVISKTETFFESEFVNRFSIKFKYENFVIQLIHVITVVRLSKNS